MIILLNESKFAAELKSAYKYGYTVQFNEGKIFILTSSFVIKTHLEDLPRKVLGILAEHIGYLPNDITLYVSRGTDNQIVMPESIETDIRIDDFPEAVYAIPTPLTYKSFSLFQKDDQQIIALNGDAIILLEAPRPPLINRTNTRAMWIDQSNIDASGIFLITTCMASRDSVQLNHLEQFNWKISEEKK